MSIAVIFPLVAPPFAAKGAVGAGKHFAKVENREVFLRTIELYTPRDNVKQRILVVTPDDLQTIMERYGAHLGFQGVAVAGGGSDWFSCVARGLEKLETGITTVMVHDPCCPAVSFLQLDALEEAMAVAKGAAGVVPTLPTRTAFADAGGGKGGGGIEEYVDMTTISEVQSPQIFTRAALEAAYKSRTKESACMDDAELVLAAGGKVLTIAGSRFNQRIDSDEALKLAGDLIGRMPKPKPKTPLTPFDEAQW